MPHCKYVKPAIAGLWNLYKVGVDTYTGTIKEIRRHKEALSPSQTMFIRYNDTYYYQVCKFKQIIHTYDWIMGPEFTDVKQLRPRLNRVCTLQEFVWSFIKEETARTHDLIRPDYKGTST